MWKLWFEKNSMKANPNKFPFIHGKTPRQTIILNTNQMKLKNSSSTGSHY